MRLLLLFLTLFIALSLHSQTFSNGFNFYLPPNDSTTQRFLPVFPKKTVDQFVSVDANGHFTAGGQPIRFWGMNMAYGACFPDYNDAPVVAARLRKMGVNLVRFTLMDSPWTDEDGTIFFGQSSTQVLSFFNLDKLNFFIAQLKNEGIYINLILQDTRTFREGDGVLHADSIYQTAKAVSMFDRHLIDLQKNFALQLLTSLNPYLGHPLAEDPVLAMVDITNENTLYGYWKSDWLRHQSQGGDLIQRHVDTLDLRWNLFLQNKYASQSELESAWNQSAGTGGQNEQVSNGGFESGNPVANFTVELHDVAQATVSADPTNPYEGSFSGRVDVLNATSTNWHIQFKQVGASLQALKTYQITFAARADAAKDILLVASRDNAPYTYYDSKSIPLSTAWQEYSFTFTAPEDNDANFRLGFQFNGQEGSYWFDQLSMTEADIAGLLPGEALAQGNIRRLDYSERGSFTPQRVADMAEFYMALQSEYFDGMYDYLKNELGVVANISGSNTWSGINDIYTVRNLDYVNDQSSWDYIQYPNGWSLSDWQIVNEPMVRSGWGSIPSLFSGLAIQGKPYTVSSYAHPFPNRYQVEMMPWMTAYASLHDAGAITYYYYNDDPENWSSDRVEDFYSLHRNTAQMALSPLYAFAFRNGLVAPAQQVATVAYSLPYLRSVPFSDNGGRWGKYIPYNSSVAFYSSVRSSFGGNGLPDLAPVNALVGSDLSTDTDETSIDFGLGILKTESPQFISVCGFMDENQVDAGALKVLSANDFGVVSWLSLDGGALPQAKESLLAISSKLQNSNMAWAGTTTINDNWGGQPTELFPLQLTLELAVEADYIQLFPLTGKGEAGTAKIILPTAPGQFLVNIDQSEDQTTWFGLEALDGPLSSHEANAAGIHLFPNPATDHLHLQWPSGTALSGLSLCSLDGKLLRSWETEGLPSWTMDVSDLAAGVYCLKLQLEGGVVVRRVVVGR
jgi:hypothetical protein